MDVPAVVATHEAPTDGEQAHPDAPFTFVTDGIEHAVAPGCRESPTCAAPPARGAGRDGADTGVVRSRTWGMLGALLLAVTLTAGCGDSGDSGDDPGAGGAASHDYLPGLASYPHLPAGATAAPVVVMIPGGAWRGADPAGLQPLARALADRGVVAVPVRIRAEGDGVYYPTPVDDVLCALADGVAAARAAGIEPTRVALLGHSSGAHLAALATLEPQQFRPRCQAPVAEADAFVGLAGPYDIRNFAEAASALFRPGAAPAELQAANPALHAADRPDVPVLLLHGGRDELVPVTFSTDFAAALDAGGHPTTLTVLPDADHDSIYAPTTVAAPIAEWLRSLPQD